MKSNKIMRWLMIFISWISIACIFAYMGILAVAIIFPGPTMVEIISYQERIKFALFNSSELIFNEYTPLGIIIGVIISEMIFILIIVLNRKSLFGSVQLNTDEGSEEGVDITVKKKKKRKKRKKKDKKKDDNQLAEVKPELKNLPDVDENVEIEGKMSIELISRGYNMNQIRSMMLLRKYIPTLNVNFLVETFDVSMTSDDILAYIDIYFG